MSFTTTQLFLCSTKAINECVPMKFYLQKQSVKFAEDRPPHASSQLRIGRSGRSRVRRIARFKPWSVFTVFLAKSVNCPDLLFPHILNDKLCLDDL